MWYATFVPRLWYAGPVPCLPNAIGPDGGQALSQLFTSPCLAYVELALDTSSPHPAAAAGRDLRAVHLRM